MILPSLIVANRCKDFITHAHDANDANDDDAHDAGMVSIGEVGFDDVHVVFFPSSLASTAKAFWQHVGEILSSRQAEAALRFFGIPVPEVTVLFHHAAQRQCSSDCYSMDDLSLGNGNANGNANGNGNGNGASPHDIIKSRIMTIIGEPQLDNSITITTSGMAAIYTALRLVRKVLGDEDSSRVLEMVVFGFPYLDTLKMMRRVELNPGGHHFFGHGSEEDMDSLEELLKERSSGDKTDKKMIGAVFTEFPTNPLLKVPNLRRLHRLSRQYGFVLVVDDTVGNFANVDLFHSADVQVDILCTSLTKIFSGTGDVMAGSVVINSLSPRASQFRAALPQLQPAELYIHDALTLERNSRDFLSRSRTIMKNAAALALWLCDRPEVQHLYYPHPEVISRQSSRSVTATTTDHTDVYTSLLRKATDNDDDSDGSGIGYGCLLSIILKADKDEKTFFDSLDFSKGPSLGTNCTLVCPYTLLAHYTELDWADSYGVDKRLVRVSVGLEHIDVIIDKFNKAFIAIS